MPKTTPKEIQVSAERLQEILDWADFFGIHVGYNASRRGFQINGVVYQPPAFSFKTKLTK